MAHVENNGRVDYTSARTHTHTRTGSGYTEHVAGGLDSAGVMGIHDLYECSSHMHTHVRMHTRIQAIRCSLL